MHTYRWTHTHTHTHILEILQSKTCNAGSNKGGSNRTSMKTLEKLKAVCHHNQERRAMGDHSKMRKGERGNQLCSSLTLDHCLRTSLKAQAKVSLRITYRQCKEVKKRKYRWRLTNIWHSILCPLLNNWGWGNTCILSLFFPEGFTVTLREELLDGIKWNGSF